MKKEGVYAFHTEKLFSICSFCDQQLGSHLNVVLKVVIHIQVHS